jgi:hypothetical protein
MDRVDTFPPRVGHTLIVRLVCATQPYTLLPPILIIRFLNAPLPL